MEYWVGLVILGAIYMIAAMSFNLLLGHAGIFSVAHAAFIGLGAYCTAIVVTRWAVLFPLGIVLGIAVATVVGWIFAKATLRVNGDYMVVASFALLIITGQVIMNFPDLTGGGFGLAGIPRPGTDTWQVIDNVQFAILCLAIAAVAYLVAHFLVKSPFGQVLRMLREDPVATASLGHYPRRYREAVFAVSSGMAAVAGSLYAHYISFITPTDFTIRLTILILTIIVIAGTHRLWAVPLGAALVMALNEGVRYVPMPDRLAAGADQIIFGALLVVFALLRPQGLVAPRRRALP